MKKIHEDSLVVVFDATATNREEIQLESFFSEMRCVAIKNFATSWSTGNSIVNSAPIVNLAGMFPDLSKVNVTASMVHIEGVNDEDVHYHTSHVVGYVIHGEGQLMVSRDPSFPVLDIVAGDVVIIPRGAMHYFVSNTKMDWIALEISDLPIDYQKHLHDDEREGIQ